jgi:hypothetical protein
MTLAQIISDLTAKTYIKKVGTPIPTYPSRIDNVQKWQIPIWTTFVGSDLTKIYVWEYTDGGSDCEVINPPDVMFDKIINPVESFRSKCITKINTVIAANAIKAYKDLEVDENAESATATAYVTNAGNVSSKNYLLYIDAGVVQVKEIV